MAGEEQVERHDLEVVAKSNKLIDSMGSPSLVASKIFLIALHKVRNKDKVTTDIQEVEKYKRLQVLSGTDFSKGHVSEIPISDLKALNMNTRSGSFYSAIQVLLSNDKTDPRTLRNNLVLMIPEGNSGVMGYTEVITGAIYDKQTSTMYIKFNSEENIVREIYNLKSGYALLPKKLMMQWKSVFSYRVYEIAQAKISYDDSTADKQHKPRKTVYEYIYDVGELKLLLGVLKISTDKEAQKEIAGVKNPDYNKIAEDMVERSNSGMSYYASFKRYTLDKAEKEINSHPDSEFDVAFEPIRSGRGGKVTKIKLIVKRREGKEAVKNGMSEEAKVEFADEAMDILPQGVRIKDIMEIAEAANYDMGKIIKAAEVLKNYTKPVENVVGFIITAINKNWDAEKVKKGHKSNHEEREYDFEELEKELLSYD